MNDEQQKCDIQQKIETPEVTQKLLKAFAELTFDKPQSLDWDQEVTFTFLLRWGLASFSAWSLFFPDTIDELWKGARSQVTPEPVMDLFTIPILLRSLYENYLVAASLLDQRVPTAIRRCRHNAWKRKGYKVENTTAEYFRYTKANVELTLKNFEKHDRLFRKHAEFNNLNKDMKNNLMRDGRIGSWSTLAAEAGISNDFHQAFYGPLCGYSHSGSDSFSAVFSGSWSSQAEICRLNYTVVAALMLDLTRQHLFRSQIDENPVLEVVMDWGLEYVRDFDRIAVE